MAKTPLLQITLLAIVLLYCDGRTNIPTTAFVSKVSLSNRNLKTDDVSTLPFAKSGRTNSPFSRWNSNIDHNDCNDSSCDKDYNNYSSTKMERLPLHRSKAISNVILSLSVLFSVNTLAIQTDFAPTSNHNSIHQKIIDNEIITKYNYNNIPSLFQFVKPVYAIDKVIDDNTLIEQKSPRQQQQPTVVNEVWNLVNKYYLDKTFNNQDWLAVKQKYESQLKIDPNTGNYNDDEAMKLTTSMVQSLGDKYSRILDKEAYARIQKFDLIGVGATLMPDSVDKRIKVGAPPVDGSEAQKAGIQYGDYIVAVNGKKTEGRTAFEIIDQISEDPDAKLITMTVLTEGPDNIKGEGYIRDVTMKRQTMEVKNPISYKISERRKDGTVVGYIRLSEFNSLVEPKLKDALSSLKQDGANAYVLDMRSNPGGAFQSAVEIAALFMEDKIATNVVDSNSVEMPFKTAKGKIMIDSSNPLVIWVDAGSASATEVLAGALHDQCRASIMGQRSFGKGLIQAVYGLQNGGGLVLTVAKYVTPNGTDIQGSGIMPDMETKLPFLYLPNISSDTSKVDFKFMKTQNIVCPADLNVQTS